MRKIEVMKEKGSDGYVVLCDGEFASDKPTLSEAMTEAILFAESNGVSEVVFKVGEEF